LKSDFLPREGVPEMSAFAQTRDQNSRSDGTTHKDDRISCRRLNQRPADSQSELPVADRLREKGHTAQGVGSSASGRTPRPPFASRSSYILVLIRV
jgi:hypothetical protein